MADIKKRSGRPKGSKNKSAIVKKSYSRMEVAQGIPEERYYPKSWINLDNTSPIIKKKGRPPASKEVLKVLNKAIDTKAGPGSPSFEKGNAPVSKGRPKGSRNKITVALEQMGEENATAVYAKLVELALTGDVHACKLILDRVYPQRKGFRFSLEFDSPVDTLEQINAISKHVLGMVVAGDVSPEEAEEYGKVLEQRLKIITDTDVVKKIENTCMLVDMMKRGASNAG